MPTRFADGIQVDGSAIVPNITVSTATSEAVNAESLKGYVPAGSQVPAGGTTGQVLAKTSNEDYAFQWKDVSSNIVIISSDFLAATAFPFNAATFGGGGGSFLSAANHPGIVRYASTAAANSGYIINSNSEVSLQAGFCVTAIFRPLLVANIVTRIGFVNAISGATTNNPTDGVYLEISNATPTFRTFSNSTGTSSTALAGLSANTWYRVIVKIEASSAICELYSESGDLLDARTINSNIPTGAGREVPVSVWSVSTTAIAQNLIELDFLEFSATGLVR